MYPTTPGPLQLQPRHLRTGPNSSFLVDNLLAHQEDHAVSNGGPAVHAIHANNVAALNDCCANHATAAGMTPRDEDDLRTPPPPPLKFGVTAILADHHGTAAKDRERLFGGGRSAAAASLLAAAAATGESWRDVP